MKALIDADACPVVAEAIALCAERGITVLLVCDTAHEMHRSKATTLVVDQGADSADFALANQTQPGDIVITQDYGLAALCLARGARAMNQNGMEYTADNIDGLLFTRHLTKEMVRSHKYPRGAKKRTAAQNEAFCRAFARLLDGAR